jgi:inner membrane protein
MSFHFGVSYDSVFGHRGWTHSILFALLIGGIFTVFAKPLQTTRWKAFVFLSLATVSHGILDAMTTGGHGIAFFWPLSDERYFFPFRFILVSPIGMRFLSARGWMTMQSELFTVWLPCLIFLILIRIARLRKHDDQTA